MHILEVLLLLSALVSFCVAIFSNPTRYNLVALGLAFIAAMLLLDSLGITQ